MAGSGIFGSLALGAASSAAGGIFGANQAQLNREWQEKMADKAWERNLQMMDKINAYNDPQSVMARLQAAGVNPAVVFGNGGMTSLSSNGFAPSGAQGAPVMPNFNAPTVGELSQSAAQLEKTKAEIDLLKSQARKEDSSAHHLDILADYTEEQKKLVQPKIDEIERNLKHLDEVDANLRSHSLNLDAATYESKIRAALAVPRARAELRQFAAVSHLTEEQARDVVLFRALKAAGMQTAINKDLAQIGVLGVEKDSGEFKLAQDKEWDDFERGVKVAKDGTQALSDVLGTISDFLPTKIVSETIGNVGGKLVDTVSRSIKRRF